MISLRELLKKEKEMQKQLVAKRGDLHRELARALSQHDQNPPGISTGRWKYLNPGKLVTKSPGYVPRAERKHCSLAVVLAPSEMSMEDYDQALKETNTSWNEPNVTN